MRERGDCRCFHEPFIYDYYVHRAVRKLPLFDIDPDQPASYAEIRDLLLAAAEQETVFFKDMSYYIVPAILEDPDFAGRITHSFLIRDPMKSILSYYKLDPDMSCEEIGLEAQWRQAEWMQANFGQTPLVIEAEAVQRAPRAMMAAYWARLGLSPADHAFDWDDGETPKDWGQVAGWHGKVSGSQGIMAPSPEEEAARLAAFEAAAQEAPVLRDHLAHHQVFYEKLRAHALMLDPQGSP